MQRLPAGVAHPCPCALWRANIAALSSSVDARIASAVARSWAALSEEVSRRVAGAHEALDARISEVRGDLDAVARSKADSASLTACAAQVRREPVRARKLPATQDCDVGRRAHGKNLRQSMQLGVHLSVRC